MIDLSQVAAAALSLLGMIGEKLGALPENVQLAIELLGSFLAGGFIAISRIVANPSSPLRYLSLKTIRKIFVRKYFIAVPMHALKESSDSEEFQQKLYDEIREQIILVEKDIKSSHRFFLPLIRVYSGVLDRKFLFKKNRYRAKLDSTLFSEEAMQESITEIESSDHFILINADKNSSSVIFEAGVAFARRMPTTIFAFNEVGLPVLVAHLEKYRPNNNSKKKSKVKIYRIDRMDEINRIIEEGSWRKFSSVERIADVARRA